MTPSSRDAQERNGGVGTARLEEEPGGEFNRGTEVAEGDDPVIRIRDAFLALPAERQNEVLAELGAELLSRSDPAAIETITRLADQAKAAVNALLGEDHPLASSAGIFRGDPFWGDTMAALRRFREPLSPDDDSSEQDRVSA